MHTISCTKGIQDDISCVNLFAKYPSGINVKDTTGRFFDQYNHRVARISTNLGESNDIRVYNGYMMVKVESRIKQTCVIQTI